MNAPAVLALIGDLYVQMEGLQRELEGTKAELAEKNLALVGKDPQYDPLGGPEEAAAAARAESEAK